jgi:hypothetical protein
MPSSTDHLDIQTNQCNCEYEHICLDEEIMDVLL